MASFDGVPGEEELSTPWIPDEVDPALVAATERALLLSWMLGMDHASGDLDLSDPAGGQLELGLADDEIPAIPFEDAIAFLKGRVPVTKPEWNDLEEKLRFRAFTVAALSTPDNINQVREHLLATMDGSSTGIGDLWNPDLLADAAGLGQNAWYWETVYRTNIQTCYSAGKAMEFRRNQPAFIELIGVDDERQTEICESLDGTILPALDPWWDTHWPPFHFGCRTTPRGIYQAEVEVMREAEPEWPPVSERPEAAPMDGFGGNPIATDSFWKLTPGMIARAREYGIDGDIQKLARDIGIKYDVVRGSEIANKRGVVQANLEIPPAKSAEVRKKVKDDLMENLRDTSIESPGLGEDVGIDRRGIEKLVAFSGEPVKLASIADISDLIQKLEQEGKPVADRKNPKAFSEVVYAKAVIEKDGSKHLIRATLKRQAGTGKLMLYDLSLG